MSYGLSPGQPSTLIDTQTATTNSGILLLRGQCERVTVAVIGAGTTSSGVVTIEEAYYDPNGLVYAGTWGPIATVNASDVSGGKQLITHITGSVWALRVRISTVIGGGGTVSVVAWGN